MRSGLGGGSGGAFKAAAHCPRLEGLVPAAILFREDTAHQNVKLFLTEPLYRVQSTSQNCQPLGTAEIGPRTSAGGGSTVKGFLLGVILTLVVGGFFFHTQSRYDTMDPCTAVNTSLTLAINADLEKVLQKKTGSDVVGQLANALLKPVADPVIAQEVKKETGETNWFQCVIELVKIDFLGQKAARVEAIKKRLSLP